MMKVLRKRKIIASKIEIKQRGEMDENGEVRPNCANAANPYHVCGAYCLEKIAGGKGYKEKDKKILGPSGFGQKPAFGFVSTPTQSSPFGSSGQQSQPAFGSGIFGSSRPFGSS